MASAMILHHPDPQSVGGGLCRRLHPIPKQDWGSCNRALHAILRIRRVWHHDSAKQQRHDSVDGNLLFSGQDRKIPCSL